MNIERFKDMIAVVDGIPAERINFSQWQQLDRFDMYRKHVTQASEIKHGTVCCAGGWVALHPDFQSQGLRVTLAGVPVMGPFEFDCSLGVYGYEALAQFFDIPVELATELFSTPQPDEDSIGDVWNPLRVKARFIRNACKYLEQQ